MAYRPIALLAGMGHGTPISTSGNPGYGNSGAYMLDVGISSTQSVARFWGLTALARGHHREAQQSKGPATHSSWAGGVGNIQKVIADALRTAGLMR